RLRADAGRKVGSGRVDELSAEKSRLAFRSLTKRPPIRRGALAFLKRLARRHRLALVSSGSRKTVGLFLRKSRSRKVFSIVITSDHVRRAKPFPDIYLKALRTLRLKAHDAVVIEDAVSGVRAARRAKIRVIAVTGTDSAARLRAAGALAVCRSLREVEKRVDRL
ncbi:MAG: HAD family hydrolase, partial [Elusimicrobia bacterium]|nr:HAD family hydrolase [Elusimicrobiota bacterium]